METEKKKLEALTIDDAAVVGKTTSATVRWTRLLAVTTMLLMMSYLVYLHVRVSRLEQCQCAVKSVRTWPVSSANQEAYKADVKSLSWRPASSESAAAFAERRSYRVRRSADSGSQRQRRSATRNNARGDVACHLQFHLRAQPNELRLIERGERVVLPHGVYDPALGFRLTRGSDDEPFVFKNWKVQHWARNSGLFDYKRRSGRLTVNDNGIYYIYAQVLYHTAAARSSFSVMIDSSTFVQCWTSVDAVNANSTSADNARFKTCYTGGVTKLHRNQEVWINTLYGHHVSTNTNSSFFGIVKLSS